MAGELNGPIPAVVCAATVNSYVVYGLREFNIKVVSIVVNCCDMAVSTSTIITVYVTIGPFWCSGEGGSHITVREIADKTSAVVLRGGPAGTTQGIQMRTHKIQYSFSSLTINFSTYCQSIRIWSC